MTTNEQPRFLFTFSPKGITKNYDYTYYDHYKSYFNKWYTVMEEFEINPELNDSGNLHYHGYYKLKDKKSYIQRWFKFILPKIKYNGMWRISEIKHDFKAAMEYPRKDTEFMRNLLTCHPNPITHESYVNMENVEEDTETFKQMCEKSYKIRQSIHELDSPPTSESED